MESRPPVDSTKVAHLQMNGIKRALCFHKKLKTPYEWNQEGSLIPQKAQNSK
jgi:hypothetical protein